MEILARNVGRGVALRVMCRITVDDQEPLKSVRVGGNLEPLVGETKAHVEVNSDTFKAVELGTYSMTANYFDATGRRYESRGAPASGEVVEILEDGTERLLFRT